MPNDLPRRPKKSRNKYFLHVFPKMDGCTDTDGRTDGQTDERVDVLYFVASITLYYI